MTRSNRRLAILAALAVLAAAWVILGIGYDRASKACYETRHALDREPEVYGGAIGTAIVIVFWPLAQAGDAINGVDCTPRPGPAVR